MEHVPPATREPAVERAPPVPSSPPALRDLVRVPGLISLTRLPLGALFPLALRHPPRALALLIVAGATDLLDGWYARTFHEETSTGALVDGITDKFFALAVVASLVAARSLTLGEVAMLATRDIGELAIAARLMASPDRRRREGVPSANAGGKLATTLQYVALAAVIVRSPLRKALIAITAAAGVAASIAYWRRELA